MKFNFNSKGRIAAGIIVTAAVVAGSIGVFAANSMDAVQKDVLMSETGTHSNVQLINTAQTLIDSQGTIEYTKTSHFITADNKFDFEENFIDERWLDPKTLENRADCKIISGDKNIKDFHSTYLKNNGTDAVTIQRDIQGNAVSGSITKMSQVAAEKNFATFTKFNAFSKVKEIGSLPEWKDEGIEKTSDGKELKKLSQTYMNSNPENVQVNTRLILYVDTATGFPAKEELYQDVNGTMKMMWYETYEYKYVDNDGKLFDTSEVKLEEKSMND